jgi:uncharacterized phiE125 gp8 family phage protein
MKFQITSQVTSEPITLEEARDHLRIEAFGSPLAHPDDAYITSLISVAREWCEQYTRRALATQRVSVAMNEFDPNGFRLPLAPLQSVTSIKYLDKNNTLQTLSSSVYYVDYFDAAIYLEANQRWPETSTRENAILIDYIAGYTNGVSPDTYPFPSPIRAAMLLLIGNWYENRQEDQLATSRASFNSLPMGVYNLLQPYRLNLGV